MYHFSEDKNRFKGTLVVEFVGLSGSGKSTIARIVHKMLKDLNHPISYIPDAYSLKSRRRYGLLPCLSSRVSRKFEMVKVVFGVFCLTPKISFFLLKTYILDRLFFYNRQIKIPHIWELFRALRSRSRDATRLSLWSKKRGIHIFDEGVMAELWGVYARYDTKISNQLLKKYVLNRFNTPVLLVFVDPVDVSTVKKRLISRAKRGSTSRYLLERPHEYQGYLHDLDRVWNSAQSASKTRKNMWVIKLINDEKFSIENNAEVVTQKIIEIVRRIS